MYNMRADTDRSVYARNKIVEVTVAWALLGMEVALAVYLYLQGQGRVVRLIDNDGGEGDYSGESKECLVGEGPALISLATVGRGVTAAIAQVVLLFTSSGGGLTTPEKAVFAVLLKLWMIFESVSCTGCETEFGTCIFVIGCNALSAYTIAPAYVEAQGVCALALRSDIGTFFFIPYAGVIALNMWVHCTREGEGHNRRNRQLGVIMLCFDSVVTGVFSAWSNYVQSGIVGTLFVLHPLAEIVISITELFG